MSEKAQQRGICVNLKFYILSYQTCIIKASDFHPQPVHLFLDVTSGIKTFFSTVLGMDNFGGMNNMDRFGSSGMGRMNGKETF